MQSVADGFLGLVHDDIQGLFHGIGLGVEFCHQLISGFGAVFHIDFGHGLALGVIGGELSLHDFQRLDHLGQIQGLGVTNGQLHVAVEFLGILGGLGQAVIHAVKAPCGRNVR